MSFIETMAYHPIHSRLPLFNTNNTYRFVTQRRSLICTYHHYPCSTQQPFYEVEIICFSVVFITQQTIYDVGVISRSDSVLNSHFTKQVITHGFLMYLSLKRPFQRFPYPLPADVVCMLLFSMNIPSICTAFPCFPLIFQCIMQHHCTVLSVQNRFFSTM